MDRFVSESPNVKTPYPKLAVPAPAAPTVINPPATWIFSDKLNPALGFRNQDGLPTTVEMNSKPPSIDIFFVIP